MQSVKKPAWQRATALVSLSTCGAMTGYTFAHGTVAELTSPASIPAHWTALDTPASSNDGALRSAIVSVAKHYLEMAQSRTPAEMETLIWQADSTNGVDHGQSCAAFASLTLALGAQAAGQQSWVTGGGSYPWPLYRWADVRVQPNPASPDVVSMVQDAQAHHRWHPLGDGYQPQPGDWVLFDGHVEVVTGYAGAALYTVGADSLPDLTVNAHKFPAPLAAQGVLGFVNNGELVGTAGRDGQSGGGGSHAAAGAAQVPGVTSQMAGAAARQDHGSAAIPGTAASTPGGGSRARTPAGPGASGQGRVRRAARAGTAAIPGMLAGTPGGSSAGQHAPSYTRHDQPPAGVPGTAAQQAFISLVAPGAIAAQQRYGIPAAVTIAQAIDESGWGQSELATADHNLFGIKGTGPAGSDMRPTQEYANGTWVTRTAPFRVYRNIAQSIADHSQLLAAGHAYQHAMAVRHVPDAFAAALTGVYATDPDYGSSLIALMRLYNLYRYDSATPAAAQAVAPPEHQVAGQRAVAPPAAVPGASAPGALADGASARGAPGVREAASVPGVWGARGAPAVPGGTGIPGGASIPGVAGTLAAGVTGARAAGNRRRGSGSRPSVPDAGDTTGRMPATRPALEAGQRPGPRIAPRGSRMSTSGYVPQIPQAVTAGFAAIAKGPLTRAQPLYQDVASRTGICWELLAACDWMQCQARPRYSPVQGEKLGTVNSDGTVFRTRSAALAQCASDLTELAEAVYLIDLTARRPLPVRELAKVFAAFRWGGLLRVHAISAMEFPYSVAGLTCQHLKMRWPDIDDPRAPDKPGARSRMPFGAVPVVLSLGYRAAP
ncbi:MAG: glucosaminidase domain-containing protein [Streptosporangiaceae bacterium]